MANARPNAKMPTRGKNRTLLRNKTTPRMHWIMPALVLLAIPMIFAFRPTHASSLTFALSDDASIRMDTPTSNYGAAVDYKVDHSPIENIVMKFTISGTAGQTITGAKLRLYVTNPSNSGGNFWRLNDTGWSEKTITWANAPAVDPAKLATLGAVTTGSWAEVDLTSLVKGDGTYAIRADSASDDGAYYSSKEGANQPQVVLTMLDPTPTPVAATPTPVASSGCNSTQAAPTNTDPGSVVLADNFESGNLSNWTPTALGDATEGIQSSTYSSSRCAALLHVTANTGSQANISKLLPAATNEVWASGWFDITREGASAASNVPTMRFFNGSTRLLDVSRQNGNGVLFVRWPTGTSFTYIDTGVKVAVGQGFNLKTHVVTAGSQSQVQIWKDGIKIFDRSSSATGFVDLGTNAGLTNFMIGAEHNAQDGDVAADDIVLKNVQPVAATPAPTAASTPASTISSTTPCAGTPAPAEWKHVVVLMFENKTYNSVVGTAAPFITNLTRKCGTYTNWKDANYRANGTIDGNYPSKPNYATLTSGLSPSAHGLLNDTYATTTNVDNIFNRLRLLGKSTKAYMAGGSGSCAVSNFSGAYHDAMRFYTNLGGQSSLATTYCNTHDSWLGNFMTDVNTGKLPAFSMVFPNNSQNMHDNSITSGDSWASTFLTPLLDSAQYKSGDTAIFFLWDEDAPAPNALIAPSIKPGSMPTTSGNPIGHFSATRTWQEMLGVSPLLGDTGQAPSLLQFYNGN